MKEQDITDELISREETLGYSFDKTADKIFEELGYKIKETTWKEEGKKHFIEYNSNDTQIQFSLDTKHILITNILNMQELQAINKKCKELEWL